MPAFLAYCLTTCQTTFSVKLLPHTVPARVTRLKIFPFVIPAERNQSSTRSLTQSGIGMVRIHEALPDHIDDRPVLLPLLQVRDVQFNGLVPPQTAGNKYGQQVWPTRPNPVCLSWFWDQERQGVLLVRPLQASIKPIYTPSQWGWEDLNRLWLACV